MTFTINPGDGPRMAEGIFHVIRTRVPAEAITDEMVAVRAQAVGLDFGDHIIVQCTNFDGTELLHETEYRVYARSEARVITSIDERAPKHVDQVTLAVARVRPWWTSPAGARQEADERALLGDDSEAPPDAPVSKPDGAHWNLGKKKFEVWRDGAVVAEVRDKAEAQALAEAA